MNWEAIGAIGEIVSAIGVIGTLVYLAIQIRANTKESQMSSTSDISDQYNSFLRHITADPELSDLWIRALDQDPESLTQNERSRALMVLGNNLRILENAYLQHKAGRMDEASWEGYEKLIYRGAYSPLFPLYWSIRKELHNTEFATLVEKALENPDKQRMFR